MSSGATVSWRIWPTRLAIGARTTGVLVLLAAGFGIHAHPLTAGPDDSPHFVRVIGGPPPSGYLNNPMGVAVSPAEDGRMYVADTDNARIHMFSRSGQPLAVWGERGIGPGHFWRPTDIGVTADGRYVYVADELAGVVQRFAPEPDCFEYHSLDCFKGDKVLTFGAGEGGLTAPASIIVGPDSLVYVGDSADDQIHVFDAAGVPVRRFGSSGTELGQLNYPADLAFTPDGLLVVADRDNHRLSFFTAEGEVHSTYGMGGRLFHPSGVAVDADGGFAVRDYDPSFGTPRLWRFDSDRRLLWDQTLGGGDIDYTYPLQGVAFLPSGGLLLTDRTADEVALQVLDRGGAAHSLALRGRELRQFDRPQGVAFDKFFVAVSDPGNHRVTLLGDEDELVASIGGDVMPEAGLDRPAGIGIYRFGEDLNDALLYVADAGEHKVVVLSPSGEVVDRWGNSAGAADDQFDSPSDVAVAPDGEVYVADTNNHRIVRRSSSGQVLGMINDAPGELEFPISVTSGPLDLIYVLEARRNRVQAYRRDGTRAFRWEGGGEKPGELWLPVAVTADRRYLYIMENNGQDHARVQVFTVEKEYPNNVLTIFANQVGAEEGEVWDPHELAVADDGRVLIADSGNNRLQLFAWPGGDPIWVPSPTPTPTDPPRPTATPPPVTPMTPTATIEIPTQIGPTPDLQPTPAGGGGRIAYMPFAFGGR